VTIEPLQKVFTDLTVAGFGDHDTSVVQRYIEMLSDPMTGGSSADSSSTGQEGSA